ncbi:MAG: hypothetical protein M3517_00495 [Actinomycetota bacterium]|nr:hypothetical protein [Actinomycetota bacterium]
MDTSDAVALVVVVLLAAVHVVAPLLTFVELEPRSWMLSAAGGISVAYVFVHLLPEIAEAQAAVEESSSGFVAQFERHAYVAALVGLTTFYGLERAAITSRQQRGRGDPVEEKPTTAGAFWVSVLLFGVYNAIIGYLVVRRAENDSTSTLVLFTVALGLHLFVNDLGLRHHHRRRYDQYGRPLLALAILAGWVVGLVTEFSEAVAGLVIALLAGGVVLNVIKEELPSERQSRFLAFAVGTGAYATLLLLL